MSTEQNENTISKVEPYTPKYDRYGELLNERKYINVAKQSAEQQVSNFNKGLVMDSNKIKALISIIIAAFVQVAQLIWNFEVPEIVVTGLTALFALLAGIFLPQPKK